MKNVPDVHVHDREIPAGKVLVAEYGEIGPDEPMVKEMTLETKTGWGRREVRLVARYAGWAIAGSMLRWDNGCYAVSWEMDGADHGVSYRTFDEALAHFNRIPEECPYRAYERQQGDL